LFEIRAGYGLYTPDSDLGTASSLKTLQGFNIDALVEIPLVPVGLGLRYETMDFAVGQLSQDFDSQFNRLSLIVNYRIIDFFFYLGGIATVGFANDAKIEGLPGGDAEFSNDLTYTVGAEGGVSLGLFQVGAELGYMLGGDYKSDNNNAYTGDPINFDSFYAKILVGVGF